MKPGVIRIAILVWYSLVASVAHSAEGGSGVYPLGFLAPQAGLMPTPGTYFQYQYYSYNGDATASVSRAGQVSVPGTSLKLPAQLNGSVKVDLSLYSNMATLTHVFSDTVLGGNPGISLVVPWATAKLSASGNGVASINGPDGRVGLSIPVSSQATQNDNGLSDSSVTGMLGWHDGYLHYMALANVYLPTGNYDPTRAVNVGRNHWAVEPMGNVTYLNEKNGIEFSAAAGVTFNQKNPDTQYKTGNEFHLDATAIQHFSDYFYVGIVGYAYKQITGDSGSGSFGDFKGRVYGLGPTIGGAIPLSGKRQLYLNARYYQESGAVNRLQGNTFWFSAAIPF